MDVMRLEQMVNELVRRQVAFEDRIQQLFSQRQHAIEGYQQVRLVRTLEEFDEEDESTYPLQGIDGANTFPGVFVDGGYTNSPGNHVANYEDRWDTAQVNIFVPSLNWVPPGTILQAWNDRGTNSTYPGEWWTPWQDRVRIGRAIADIGMGDNGNVREWLPDNYDPETDSERNWYCRSLLGLSEANTWVKFVQIENVAYIIAKACTPEDYYYAGDG